MKFRFKCVTINTDKEDYMEHIFLNNVTEGTKFDGFYIVKSIAVKESSNGSSYLDLTVSDNSGTMDGKFWNLTRDMERHRAGRYL